MNIFIIAGGILTVVIIAMIIYLFIKACKILAIIEDVCKDLF